MHRAATICVLALAASSAMADVTSVSSTLVGGYNAAGGYSNTFAFQNYFTGSTATGPQPDRRSFYIFSVPMLPGPVTSAKMVIRNPWVPFPASEDGTPGYFSDDATETFRLSDTPFPPSAITAPHTVPEAIGIWSTLGTGEYFGSIDVAPATGPDQDLEIALSPAAIAYINGHMGTFMVLGGHVSTLDGTSPDELVFGYSDIPSPHITEPRLSLTFVPAPGALSALAGAMLLAARRRR